MQTNNEEYSQTDSRTAGYRQELCNRNIEEDKHIPWTKEGYKTDVLMYSWTDRCNLGGVQLD